MTKQNEIRCKTKFINIYSSFLLILQLFDWYWLYSKAIRWERSQWQFSDWLIVAFLLLLCTLSIFHFGLCTWKCSIPRATLRGGKVLPVQPFLSCSQTVCDGAAFNGENWENSTINNSRQSHSFHQSLMSSSPMTTRNEQEQKHLWCNDLEE